jgi:hypothetical protein
MCFNVLPSSLKHPTPPSVSSHLVAPFLTSLSPRVHTALVDFTGGNGSSVCMRDKQYEAEIQSGVFWKKFLGWYGKGYLLGCGSNAGSDSNVSDLGIVQGHAYSIHKVVEAVDQYGTHQLVMLKNPWGKKEWQGKYCDEDKRSWTKRLKTLVDYDPAVEDSDDGMFFMGFHDFTSQFRNIYILRRFKPASEPGGWHRYHAVGEWRGDSAGGCPNNRDTCWKCPHFLIEPSRPMTLFISVAQHERKGYAREFHAHGFKLLNNGAKRCKFVYVGESVGGGSYCSVREVTAEVEVSPGDTALTLFVSTFAPREEASFTVTVYATHPLLNTAGKVLREMAVEAPHN